MRLMKINILIWLIWCNKNWDKLKENIFLHSFEILKFKANIFSVYYIPRELHNVFTFLTDTIYFIFFISCHCHFIAVRKKIISVSYSMFIFLTLFIWMCGIRLWTTPSYNKILTKLLTVQDRIFNSFFIPTFMKCLLTFCLFACSLLHITQILIVVGWCWNYA